MVMNRNAGLIHQQYIKLRAFMLTLPYVLRKSALARPAAVSVPDDEYGASFLLAHWNESAHEFTDKAAKTDLLR